MSLANTWRFHSNYPMLKCCFIHSQLSDQSSIRKVNSGCPRGGIISPVLWSLFVNELLEILNFTSIWAQVYADDMVVCTIDGDIQTASELMQNALSKIENWCHSVGLTVNPNKDKLLLSQTKESTDFYQYSFFKPMYHYTPRLNTWVFIVHIDWHSTSNYLPIVFYIKIANFSALFGRHHLIQFTNNTS